MCCWRRARVDAVLDGAARVPRRRQQTLQPVPPSLSGIQLTPAELQVLGLLARGLHNAAIAVQLGKREKTVRNQVSSILRKLGAHTRAEAVALARDAGIGEPSR